MIEDEILEALHSPIVQDRYHAVMMLSEYGKRYPLAIYELFMKLLDRKDVPLVQNALRTALDFLPGRSTYIENFSKKYMQGVLIITNHHTVIYKYLSSKGNWMVEHQPFYVEVDGQLKKFTSESQFFAFLVSSAKENVGDTNFRIKFQNSISEILFAYIPNIFLFLFYNPAELDFLPHNEVIQAIKQVFLNTFDSLSGIVQTYYQDLQTIDFETQSHLFKDLNNLQVMLGMILESHNCIYEKTFTWII